MTDCNECRGTGKDLELDGPTGTDLLDGPLPCRACNGTGHEGTAYDEDVQLGEHRILKRSGLARHPAFTDLGTRAQVIAWWCPCARCKERRSIIAPHETGRWSDRLRTGAFDLAAYPHIDAVLEALS